MRSPSAASRGPRATVLARACRPGRAAHGGFVAGRESLQAGLDADPAAADRLLELLSREGQGAGRRERAEQHRRDRPAGLFRQHREVGGDQARGGGPRPLQQLVAVDPAVAHGRALGHRIDAVGGDDEGGAPGRHQSALQGAPGFHQLGGDHHVQFAGHGSQCQHRLRARRQRGLREQFDVVDRRPGALRHARHRGGLRQEAVGLAQVHQPVGQHAAALAAHGQQRDGDGARLRHAASPARRRSIRSCSQPITAAEIRCLNRSQRVGLFTISAR